MLINTSNNPLITTIHLLSSIGAINWGLVGLFNLVTLLFSSFPIIVTILYIIIGFCGVYSFLCLGKLFCKPGIEKAK
ncbi:MULTISPECIES: DUF378 domain-containing protein [Rickettsia]|uniref:DUF378 domain-containing protein n=2 Tax=spotted fever group TaxID=114277 RepID=A0A8E0WKW9_9RICK|nr:MULTISPECIES: DUF378 domain-containing protein [Rickettsia]CDI29285.1 hypothetical protein RMONA_3120 [Rickettsia monacensis IrR/Munich]EER22811.1 hypothetical protein REIS_2057 [Rickettsia endosymbiont of Ixodes scapularis]KDO02516.1 hypothetical protein REISMN_06585 [Rickettsia tamurae subsp. buchneri]KJW03580.1 hypothetical protein REIP_1613 [Rickettsia endosymbiont of Ixodes pacificus]CEO17099.1 hypothetical protein RMONA_03540 [Rickettsia monacensis]